ncbi:hypothetical protein PV646_31065 [Streptomyces sp. ID05-26A]|nr:hypothetical protein [Streptomyces sp. ID05-26A]
MRGLPLSMSNMIGFPAASNTPPNHSKWTRSRDQESVEVVRHRDGWEVGFQHGQPRVRL